ncbi:exodeoxyribonuclease III [Oscillospiraceae bacterium HV4-5-C5C]|nr:exodeoxyribonuclease III [Oscillospiraceae bacterium HV4-5-C5C]
MRFISWNVNGLRALMKKGFMEQLEAFEADAVCLQETKLQAGQLELQLPGYYQYWNYAERKGYSGTAIFTRHEPISVRYGMGLPEHDTEGRVITLEYPGFYLVTCYTPNSKDGLLRLPYRETWEDSFRGYLCTLDADKPLILCGDLNVAHEEIDLKNPDTNHLSAGFSDEERAKFSALLDAGFVDTFRFLYPEQKDAYSWWSYRTAARKRNAGWRIDYFIVSQRLIPYTKDAAILSEVMGSDHCPVSLDLDPPEEELRHG